MANIGSWDKKPWQRGNDSLVAVNPERITTLLDLAVEYYGKQCAKCQAKGHRVFVVHHRHYRTVGFEKPVEDIVLLCKACHEDIHTRAKSQALSIADLPFVDPEWASWLPSEKQIQAKKDANQRYKERIAQLATYPLWRAEFQAKDGRRVFDSGRYADEEEARRNFEAERQYYDYAEVVSVTLVSK